MANIISIATALPNNQHQQSDILKFMQQSYQLDELDKRKLAFLYNSSGIHSRYSVIPDFSLDEINNSIWGQQGIEISIDERMLWYKKEALPLSLKAIETCIEGFILPTDITHLITVSCTGMSAPGLDLEILEALNLSPTIFRTSVNFMGCYGAIHALKWGHLICTNDSNAKVIIVATELCTLHFQHEYTLDNATSSLLFADGSAAILLSNDTALQPLASLDSFSSKVVLGGKKDMSWELSSKGFLMTLSSYIPQLIQEDIEGLVQEALEKSNLSLNDVKHWCVHPGGRKILDNIEQKMKLPSNSLVHSRDVLRNYGNMSSPTILFVLKAILLANQNKANVGEKIFGVAFGPGLTMETFTATIQ